MFSNVNMEGIEIVCTQRHNGREKLQNKKDIRHRKQIAKWQGYFCLSVIFFRCKLNSVLKGKD